MYNSRNKRNLKFLSLLKLYVLLGILGLLNHNSDQVLAQIRGTDSQQFLNQGDRQLDPEIQNLENPPTESPSLEQDEQDLEQDLNIQNKDPNAPEEEEIPSPPLGDGDNVSTPPPLGETEIKFPVP